MNKKQKTVLGISFAILFLLLFSFIGGQFSVLLAVGITSFWNLVRLLVDWLASVVSYTEWQIYLGIITIVVILLSIIGYSARKTLKKIIP